MTPLNGSKTHPLTDHARDCLKSLDHGPRPRQEFNPGVVNRLLREDLAAVVSLPSPYPSHKGACTEHLVLTVAGRAVMGRPKGVK